MFRGPGLFYFSVVAPVPSVGFVAFLASFPLVVLLWVLLVLFPIGGFLADPLVGFLRFSHR